MVTRSGVCAVCGRGVTVLFTCILCGATVCSSDFNQNMNVCRNCAVKFRQGRAKEVEREMP